MSKGIMITGAGELADGRPYAERSEREPGLHDKAAEFLLGCTIRPARRVLLNSARGLASIVPLVKQHELTFARTSDADLATLARGMRARLRKEGFAEVRKVFNEVKRMPVLKKFLRGFFFYSMGVQTVMLAATLFGSKLLHLDDTKLIITIVAIQLIAIAGAIVMSRLSARYGNIRVLMGVIVFWIFICVAAYETANFADRLKPDFDRIEMLQQRRDMLKAAVAAHGVGSGDTELGKIEAQISAMKLEMQPRQAPIEYSFYVLALAVGLVMGGIQSLSRSTYSKLMPETKDTASYFSYFDLTEKIAIVIGMFCFGFIDDMTHSMKNSIISLTVFFVIGLVWLYSALVKQKQEANGGLAGSE